MAQDSHTLNQVAAMIVEEDPGLEGYSPSIAVVISWFEARLQEDSTRDHEDGGEGPVIIIVNSNSF